MRVKKPQTNRLYIWGRKFLSRGYILKQLFMNFIIFKAVDTYDILNRKRETKDLDDYQYYKEIHPLKKKLQSYMDGNHFISIY